MDNSGILLDVDTANEASEMLLLHIKSYAWLAAKFDSERLMAFKIRPKFHYLWHQACQIREWRINVGVFATWSDESFLGKIKLVATACHGKTHDISCLSAVPAVLSHACVQTQSNGETF